MHWRLFSTVEVVQYSGGCFSTVEVVQYSGGCSVQWGIASLLWRLFSTVGDTSVHAGG